MGPAGETWSQWILGHRPFTRVHQIDRLVAVVTGTGTRTIKDLSLPHGRYTVYVRVDRDQAIRFFEMTNESGFHLVDDWKWGDMGAPLVQTEVPKGDYRMTIEARVASACWEIQVVLNSMFSWQAAPELWRPILPPPAPIELSASATARFQIVRTGHYGMDFSIEGFRPNQRVFPAAFCPFRMGLRAADGHTVHLGEGGTNSASWPSGAFLGAGDWAVEIETACDWQLTIKPMVGPCGGGARWF